MPACTWTDVDWSMVSTCVDSTNSMLGSSGKDCIVKSRLMKASAAGDLWSAVRLRAADDRYGGLCQRCLVEGSEIEEDMLHRVWLCPCNPKSGIFGATDKWSKKAEEKKEEYACFWLRDLVPKAWTEANLWPEYTPGIVECMTWEPDICFSDASGGTHSSDPRLRRTGWGIVRLDHDGELVEACHGGVPGKQMVPRAELVALVTLAEKMYRISALMPHKILQWLFEHQPYVVLG